VLILLYDGAINFLNRAKNYLAANDMAEKGMAISKALDVLNELDSALNMEKGGELSANLHNLYAFCSKHLVMANLKKDAKRIDEVINILSGLRSAYTEILSLPEAQAAAQTASAAMRSSAFMPSRAQVGISQTGGAMPAPGANARIRHMHEHTQQNTAEALPQAELVKYADSAKTPAVPVVPHTLAPVEDIAAVKNFGGSSFIKRNGAEMYRKFAEG
jgi:flagellar protein FliS